MYRTHLSTDVSSYLLAVDSEVSIHVKMHYIGIVFEYDVVRQSTQTNPSLDSTSLRNLTVSPEHAKGTCVS